jgi:membrane-bound serine protease (ClpP class)
MPIALLGIVVGLLGLSGIGTAQAASPPAAHPDQPGTGPVTRGEPGCPSGRGAAGRGTVDYFELTGVIDQVSARATIQQIAASEKSCAEVLIIRLDTPGGLRVPVASLVDQISNSTVPVVTWIGPSGARVAGVGVLIAAASSLVVTSPGTALGPLVPVNLDTTPGSAGAGAMSYLRSVAARRHRSIAAFTSPSARIRDTAAAQDGFANFEAADLSTVLENLSNRIVPTAGGTVQLPAQATGLSFYKMGFVARLVHTADRPSVAYMFLLLGVFGLVFELYFPGIGAAGLMGGTSLVIGLYGCTLLPTSWAALALLMIGLLLFVPDMHNGGLGPVSAAGAVGVTAGSLLLFPHAQPALQLPTWAIVAGVVGTAIFFIQIMTAALRARLERPPAGAEGLMGSIGVARTDLIPDGQVTAGGSLWRARTMGAAIAEGSRVRVRSVSGIVLLVDAIGLEEELAEATARPREPEPARDLPLPPEAQASANPPVSAEPVSAEPVSAEPVSAEPVSAEPVSAEPARADPLPRSPGSAGTQPVSPEPSPPDTPPILPGPAGTQPT